jgi:hypothetical protein
LFIGTNDGSQTFICLMGADEYCRLISQAVAATTSCVDYGFRNSSCSLAVFAAIRRASSRVKGYVLVAPEFRYIEVVFTTDARGKIHRQFVAALLDIHVVG